MEGKNVPSVDVKESALAFLINFQAKRKKSIIYKIVIKTKVFETETNSI